VTPRTHHLGRAKVPGAVVDDVVLAVACFITFLLVTHVLSRLYFVSQSDELLGGMWAVISTIFVIRHSYQQSLAAAVSRMSATLVSFVVCLIYLAFLPFHPWAMALLIGISAVTPTLLGRPDDATTAAITTAVIMVVVAVDPHHAWQQPILRFADTVIGVGVGVTAAWIDLRVLRIRMRTTT
jgi:uncharacterized membrane protein YgaE (UPF0421/DUF939 family)